MTCRHLLRSAVSFGLSGLSDPSVPSDLLKKYFKSYTEQPRGLWYGWFYDKKGIEKFFMYFDKPTEEMKIILDLCGGTGAWSQPYKDAGYNVINVDILYGLDVRTYEPPPNVYGILAAPPCPMFSFCRTKAKQPRDLRGAMEIVYACLRIIWECQYRIESDTQKYSPLKFWALENPNGMLKYFLGRPTFEFSPYEFGDNYKKKTHIWGWFNEPIKNPIECTQPKFDRLTTREIHGEFYGKLTRTQRRAITPSGFAQAFFKANQ